MDNILTSLRAASDPTRLRLLVLCKEGVLTVTELTQIIGQSQPVVSRHLKVLCDAKLIDRFREGQRVFYRLSDLGHGEGATARKLLALLPKGTPAIEMDLERLKGIMDLRAEEAEKYFRDNAVVWDTVRSLYIDESEIEVALLSRFPVRSPSLLDIGTGTGRILQLLAHRVDRGVGIDSSYEMLSVARANLERDSIKHCHVRHADMYRLGRFDCEFDAVVIHQVLHFAQNPELAIREAARVLQPDGHLFLIDFAPHGLEFLRDNHAHRRLGFNDAEISTWGQSSDLELTDVQSLLGKPLTVKIWTFFKKQGLGELR